PDRCARIRADHRGRGAGGTAQPQGCVQQHVCPPDEFRPIVMRALLMSAALALVLEAGGAFADPLPEGIAAPSAPDTPVPPDKGQPPEQHDVPAVPPPP